MDDELAVGAELEVVGALGDLAGAVDRRDGLPAGRLYQTQQGASVTRFLYDGLDAIAEYNASGTLLRRYVHGPGVDEPIVQYEGSGTSDRRWLVQDQLGSVIAAADASGAIIGTPNTYDEYGQPGGANTGRSQYTGQMWLAEAGVYHYKARAYAPSLGRFLQTDPIFYAGGMNLYGYVGNDPINFLDPLGLQLFPNGDGPIIQQPTTTETITVTGQRPCPRGWTCSATCPMTENCNDDPFGTPALGGNTGTNQLPNVEIDWNEVRRRATAREREQESALTDALPTCPVNALTNSAEFAVHMGSRTATTGAAAVAIGVALGRHPAGSLASGPLMRAGAWTVEIGTAQIMAGSSVLAAHGMRGQAWEATVGGVVSTFVAPMDPTGAAVSETIGNLAGTVAGALGQNMDTCVRR